MEIPTLTDFLRLEGKIEELGSFIKTFMVNQPNNNSEKSLIMNVKEVKKEFKQSAHHQRIARNTSKLKFIPSGRDIKYHRSDVEEWMKTKTVS